jgi:hypothetical protein
MLEKYLHQAQKSQTSTLLFAHIRSSKVRIDFVPLWVFKGT